MQGAENAEKGVLGGAPSDLFEIAGADAQMLADASPFPSKPQPIGGSRKGIPNRRTQAFRDLYLRMGLPHPLLWQGQLLQRGVDRLVEDLGCERLEAAELLAKVADRLAPYIEGKMPLMVKSEQIGRPVMVLGDLGQAIAEMAGQRREGALAIDDELEGAMIELQQNQRVSEAEARPSHDAASHDEAKPMKSPDNPKESR